MVSTRGNAHNAEELLWLLNEITVTANEADSIEEALRSTLSRVCELLGWEVAHVYNCERDSRFIPINLWHFHTKNPNVFRSLSEDSQLLGEQGLAGRVVKQRQTIWLEDLKDGEGWLRQTQSGQLIQSAAAIPIWAGKEVAAVIEFFRSKPMPSSHIVKKALDNIGIQLGRVIEHNRAYEILRANERKFRAVFEEAGVGIALIDPKLSMIHCNKALQSILGFNQEELCQATLDTIVLSDAVSFASKSFIHQLFEPKTEPYTVESLLRHQEGRTVWGKITISNILTEDQCEYAYAVLLIEDISEEKRIREENRQLQKELADLSWQERWTIGQYLHDTIGQELTSMGFTAKKLARRLQQLKLPEAKNTEELAEGLKQVLNNVRYAVQGLIPLDVSDIGLVEALKELALQTYRLHKIDCRYLGAEAISLQDNQIALQLYRIMQEALNNAVKHAKATHIWIDCREEDNRLMASLCDNGRGIPADQPPNRSGLTIIKYRADLINAELKIFNLQEGGTCVQCELPLNIQ